MSSNRQNAVVLACDANYAPYALFLAQQIAVAHTERDFDICIFSQDDIEIPAGLHKHDIKTQKIPGDNPFRDGPNPSRHGEAAYLRLLIPPLVADQYQRVLYLDSDIFLSGEGIDKLLKVDMFDSPVAAVRDNVQWRTPTRLVPEFKALRRPAAPYFNSGVLLIDVAKYQENRVLDQCLELLRDHRSALQRHDQSLLNLIMQGSWVELNPVWNWQYTWSSRFFADLVEPRLIHFIGPRKPWKDKDFTLPPRYRRAYHQHIATHYPTAVEAMSVDPNAPCWPTNLRKTFLKHLTSATRLKRYLNTFEDEYSTRLAHEMKV